MCESTAYVRKDEGGEVLLLKDVATIRPEGSKLVLRSILGDRLEFDGVIEEVDLMGHRILLRQRQP
ncbi:MAG: CooT family nickel-binding protein [Deltaproteobacteria bacterium]|nr:CooT family nickel-binding protein [Deltaproteobacteria bacterium]